MENQILHSFLKGEGRKINLIFKYSTITFTERLGF